MEHEHVIHALKRKRAEVGGEIKDLEKTLKAKRATLASIDATLHLFSPTLDPRTIMPKRLYRRTFYFGRNELHKLTLDALRIADRPLSTLAVGAAILAAKGLNADDRALQRDMATRAGSLLRGFLKRGVVTKTGAGQVANWSLAASEN